MKRQVSIAIPCAQVVEPRVLQSMLSMVNYSANHGIEIVHCGVTERALVDDARNGLADAFLKSPTEWIFWMDSDMTFPPDTLVQLFDCLEKKDAKMATGIYYQRKGMNYPCIWSRGEQLEDGTKTGLQSPKSKTNKYLGTFIIPHPEKKEPFKVHAAGFGCALIHREVFEVMPRPWFQFIKGTCSEDFYFFVNAHDMGYDLWAVPTIDLGHIGDAPIITKADWNRKALQSKIDVVPVVNTLVKDQ